MDALSILREYGIEGEIRGSEFRTLCPFHNDTDPSCSIHLEKEVFNCLSCDAQGSLVHFLAAKMKVTRQVIKKYLAAGTSTPSTLSTELILNWHKNVLEKEEHKARFRSKGISDETIATKLLGYDGTRYIVPIPNSSGEYINARKWSPKAKKKKWINMSGYGTVAIYPIAEIDNPVIVITEGELKALLFKQLGYPAITATGGSKSWNDEWSVSFKSKTVYLCFDIDKAGQRGARKVAKSLYRYTKEVYIILLPLNIAKYPTGDITDYIVTEKHTAGDVAKLLKDAIKWEPIIYEEDFDDEVYEVSLIDATKAEYAGKIIQTRAVVSAKDTTPFLVPSHVEIKCSKDQDICALCKVFTQSEFKFDKRHPVILELINVTSSKQTQALRKLIGAPSNCKTMHIKTLDSMNVEEIRLIPEITNEVENTTHVVRRGFYIGHGIETNANYTITARVCPLPDTQQATLLIFKAEPAVDNLTTFELKEDLSIFQPIEWTKESIGEKLTEIYLDFEANVTRIYKRPDLHLFYDLVYHSVLYIPFQGQVIKGWIEGLVLGDSGQGKSETIVQLKKHYKLGERIDVKTASSVGLVGGLQESGGRWFITWGVIPLNDRRLVILEEIKGIEPETIAKLTEIRSSGIAEITKIEKARTNARVRLIWISNARTDRQVLTYSFGVEAIKELIGSLEDVRRFDFAIILTVEDVDIKYLNQAVAKIEIVEHHYTSTLCQNLVLWGWSRTHKQVVLQSSAVTEILKVSSEMGKTYTSKIPIVEAADQRLKITRLATALAVRTFSTEDNLKVIVRKCHVEYIAEYLDMLYSSTAFGYKDYSEMIQREQSVGNEEAVIKTLSSMPFAASCVETFLNTRVFGPNDICDWTEWEMENARKLIGFLVRNNAIKRYKRGYIKNQAFIALLKTLKDKGLKDETNYDILCRSDI